MPIYEYICEECQTPFEKIVFNQQQEIACPKCSSTRNTIQLSVFSSTNGNASASPAESSAPSSGGGCCGGGCGCN